MQKLIYDLDPSIENNIEAINALESGKVLHIQNDTFQLRPAETMLLTPQILDKKSKNISYEKNKNKLSGLSVEYVSQHNVMLEMMRRYADFTEQRLKSIFPDYNAQVKTGRTSYRPAEIYGRKTSKRKDDTRLHVDSFAATPVNGLRILRFFCNINPHNQARIWHLGEQFTQVLEYFAHTIKPYRPAYAKLLHALKINRSMITNYDHKMLQLHDGMKSSDEYQLQVTKHRVEFAPYSSWIVFTDYVSHAALSGQFVLEQTFYIPVSAMRNPDLSPIKQLNSWWAV